MKPATHIGIIRYMQHQLAVPVGPSMTRQYHKGEQLHDRDDVGLVFRGGNFLQGFSIPPHGGGMKDLSTPVYCTNPIQSVASPPVIRVRAVAPGRANRSRIGRSFSNTEAKLD